MATEKEKRLVVLEDLGKALDGTETTLGRLLEDYPIGKDKEVGEMLKNINTILAEISLALGKIEE